MPHLYERHTLSFVVRLWVEPIQAHGPPQWRGQIEHVASGKKTHFQLPADVVEFLADHLAAPHGGDGAPARSDPEPHNPSTGANSR
ncbi:MAG TPA: hypothetical protein VER55_07545 [Ardenticatenaceae bacterium]|nr:hypothetical protein [Ardenticatenaceae bacterium]